MVNVLFIQINNLHNVSIGGRNSETYICTRTRKERRTVSYSRSSSSVYVEEGGYHSEQSSLQLYNLHGRASEGEWSWECSGLFNFKVQCNSVTTGQEQMTTVKVLCPSSQGTGYGYCILLGYLRMPGRCMPVSSHPERFILHNCSLLVYTLIEVLHSPVQSKDFWGDSKHPPKQTPNPNKAAGNGIHPCLYVNTVTHQCY